jgi:hypothetical protein
LQLKALKQARQAEDGREISTFRDAQKPRITAPFA